MSRKIPSVGAVSEEKRERVGDIDTAVVDSLKVLDLKWPIREADMETIQKLRKVMFEADIYLNTLITFQFTLLCSGPVSISVFLPNSADA